MIFSSLLIIATPYHDYCSTLQHTAAHCNTLQHTAAHCSTLQHTAAHCNILQHTAAHCSTMQHTAPPCTTLPHTTPHPPKFEFGYHYYIIEKHNTSEQSSSFVVIAVMIFRETDSKNSLCVHTHTHTQCFRELLSMFNRFQFKVHMPIFDMTPHQNTCVYVHTHRSRYVQRNEQSR